MKNYLFAVVLVLFSFTFCSNALYFDGDDDYVSISHYTPLVFNHGANTISFWFNAQTVADAYIIGNRSHSGGGYPDERYGINIELHEDGSLEFQVGSVSVFTPPTTIEQDTWYHIFASTTGFGNGNVNYDHHIYVDGVLMSGDYCTHHDRSDSCNPQCGEDSFCNSGNNCSYNNLCGAEIGTAGQQNTILFGKNPLSTGPDNYFHGMLDEILIFYTDYH